MLLITGHATVETAVDAMREGAEDYLSKPVKLAELRAKLARAVEKSRLRRTTSLSGARTPSCGVSSTRASASMACAAIPRR